MSSVPPAFRSVSTTVVPPNPVARFNDAIRLELLVNDLQRQLRRLERQLLPQRR
jgi:hypothetical protein